MKQTLTRVAVYVLLPALLVTAPFFFFAGAEKSDAYDWYFKPNDEHRQPAFVPEATFLKDYDGVIACGDPDQKTLYLTFDAGYDNGCMADILDTLKEKNVPAAFFVDGNFVKNEPELVKRISGEGHILGNHSLSHANMATLTDFAEYAAQITGWDELVREAGGTPTKFFRFPAGKFSKLALDYNEKLGLRSVFWSFAYYDWDVKDQPDPKAATEKILSRTHNGAVMLLHSVSRTNADILPALIDTLREQGYTFASLDKIA